MFIRKSCLLIGIVLFSITSAYTQKLDTVAGCRKQANTWFQTIPQDVKELTTSRLGYRAGQIANCVTSVDNKGVEVGMSLDGGLTPSSSRTAYLSLLAAYYKEISDRELEFIQGHGLFDKYFVDAMSAPARK